MSGDQLLRAARLALAGHDPDLAIRLVDASPDDDDARPVDRAEVLVEAHDMLGQHDEVERDRHAPRWTGSSATASASSLSRRLAETRFSSRRDLAGALAAFEAARERVRDPEELGAARRLAGRSCSPTPDDPPRRCESWTRSSRPATRGPRSSSRRRVR